MTFILVGVAAILAGITLVQTRGTSLLAWAILCLAAVVLIPALT